MKQHKNLSNPTPKPTPSPTWVFGYGSLIWRPGFEYVLAQQARIHGLHRSLCIYSHHYRGTKENPGLVFGLVRGGSCQGMAFQIDPRQWACVHAYLRDREQVTMVYHEAVRSVRLDSGQKVQALTFVVNEGHDQFAGRLTDEEQMKLVMSAHGDAGSNRDYVQSTVEHLNEMGIRDRHLSGLSKKMLAK